MITGLMLTMGSLLFIILLLLVYFSKQRFLSMRNKIYRYMLIAVLILLITEILATFCVGLCGSDFANLLMYRIHWSTGLIWFGLLYYYSMVFISEIKVDNFMELVKYTKTSKIIGIVFLILSLIYFIVPFERLDPSYISYIPGPASYYVLAFCALSVFLIVIYILKHGKNASFRTKASVWIMVIEMAIIFALQLAFPTIAFSAIGAALQMFFLYFNVENPDLKIIKEVEALKSDIERSNRAKSDFLSNMSHEIRSPMNAIVGFSETLLNSPTFDEKSARSDIDHIASAGNNLLDIINNILDISKIESGKETLEKKEYMLSNVIMELTSIIEARLGTKPVKLMVNVDKIIPSKFYGDKGKLFQILLNILTNAVKYTEVGKIKLDVTGERTGDHEKLLFKVSDTGYGIKKEDYNKLFEKFSRLENATTNEIEGTGLGLVITKKYTDLMNGKIWFESEYEVGTTFYLEITEKIVDYKPIGEITEPIKNDKEIEYLDCSSYSVLIVDDNKLNIKVASRILGKYGFNIDTSDSGKDCIYKIKEGKHYDIIFLDHMMPEMDGIETLHILKKLDGYELPPIVALTANAITGMKEMYLKEGFDEYLSKPINIAELNKLINRYFDK